MEDNFYQKLEKDLPGILKNIPFKKYTTFKIGGPAKYFFVAKNKEDIVRAIKVSKKFKIPVFILSGGSNLLVSDKGFDGLVINLKISDFKFKGNKIYVGAGMGLTKLADLSAKRGLAGLEWASGIPGTIGGAVYGCAQAFGDKISDSVEKAEALDIKTLKIKNFSKKQCSFSLKNSVFKKNKNLIIISVVLKFKNGNKKEIQEKIKEYLNYRKKNHPMNFPSAGSVFVNPESNKKVIHAGYLIEKCGLKGKKIGKAQISKMHSNFIINLGGAKAKDVLKLINLARLKVKKTFKINLEAEVQFVGFKK
jgi:UDP-N-acetylmuramate dehydrogenase